MSYLGSKEDRIIQAVMSVIINKITPIPTISKVTYKQVGNPSFILILDQNPSVLLVEEKMVIEEHKEVKVIPELIGVPGYTPGGGASQQMIKGLSPITIRLVSGEKRQLVLTIKTHITIKVKRQTPTGIIPEGLPRLNDTACSLNWGWMEVIIVFQSRKMTVRTLPSMIREYIPTLDISQYSDIIIFSRRPRTEGIRPPSIPGGIPRKGQLPKPIDEEEEPFEDEEI